ncbi:MAG: Rne/Rng family ribonuclease [Candidatus Aegiribacteria sp.]|nr:Rne/Rng family ribonuclease [Candidatus Aegiribacteria sp.]MBD3294877.1 Rne/Rng family ribonuclease [Candidatus Fermentibacteria bacterium]
MKVDFIINSHPEVTRIGILEDGRLMEIIVEDRNDKRQVGNIYLGKVNAVLPGMQAAFVDIGLERSAFLHVSDIRTGSVDTTRYARSLASGSPASTGEVRDSIEKVLRKGQDILVQVTKEPIGTKGARVTTRISIAGRYIVSMPGESVTGISRKISDRRERSRLRKVLSEVKIPGFGIIARTAGVSQDEKAFRTDMNRIVGRWKEIGQSAMKKKSPALLHQEQDIVTIAMRDLVNSKTHSIVTDSKEMAKSARAYLKTFDSGITGKVKYYRGKTPIFDHFGIEQEIAGIMAREVPLKSGGSLVIEHTEALVAIDVNTKKYVGRKKQENTIFKTNLEAAREVARQLRLRDLGGIIVIDFIDMDIADHKEKVLNTLRSELGRDRSPTKTCQVSSLGLVEMTRKRVRPSVFQALSEPCECCGGSGRVMSLVSTANKLDRTIERASLDKKHKSLVISVHPKLAEFLMEEEGRRMNHIDSISQLQIDIREDNKLRVDEFRVFSLDVHKEITDLYNRSGSA